MQLLTDAFFNLQTFPGPTTHCLRPAYSWGIDKDALTVQIWSNLFQTWNGALEKACSLEGQECLPQVASNGVYRTGIQKGLWQDNPPLLKTTSKLMRTELPRCQKKPESQYCTPWRGSINSVTSASCHTFYWRPKVCLSSNILQTYNGVTSCNSVFKAVPALPPFLPSY